MLGLWQSFVKSGVLVDRMKVVARKLEVSAGGPLVGEYSEGGWET